MMHACCSQASHWIRTALLISLLTEPVGEIANWDTGVGSIGEYLKDLTNQEPRVGKVG